jgi:prophage DNA circulation protein
MPYPSIGEIPMTGAERQARYRAARAAGKPVIRPRRPTERADRWMQHRSASRPDRRGRAQRWIDARDGLVAAQAEYADWLEALPDNQQDSALAETLRAIVDLDLSELLAIEPPRGFGRD